MGSGYGCGLRAWRPPSLPPPPPPSSFALGKHDDGSAGGGFNPSGGTGGGSDAHFTQSEWGKLGPDVHEVFKDNVSTTEVQRMDTPAAAAGMEKMAPMGTPILGVCSNIHVRPQSPSTSGIEDLFVSLLVWLWTRCVLRRKPL
ncbi:hypothetical protein D1007_13527 [Hordeum vulgare]|nr:hypothetical protein D1007_13527 [Hordeum vulgare]